MKIHWKNVALLLVIGWFFGAASGLLIMRFYRDRPLLPHKHFERMREHFSRDLDMTPEQKTQMDAILQTSRQKLDGVFSETETRVQEVRNSTRAQIRQLLLPAQQTIFDQLQAKWAAKNKKKRLDVVSDRF
jgi:Spy/CpxP family protein refolding chaperone